eukprot:6214847-Pleurochrysis_carterae.AAC.8
MQSALFATALAKCIECSVLSLIRDIQWQCQIHKTFRKSKSNRSIFKCPRESDTVVIASRNTCSHESNMYDFSRIRRSNDKYPALEND